MYQEVWSQEAPSRDEVDAISGPVLVEFGAEWCPHCQAVQQELEALLQGVEMTHLKIADGKGRPLGRSFGVKLWPNFVFLRDGELKAQLARPSSRELSEAFARLSQ